MSDPKPTRIGMTVGSTSRNGGEFEFRKISLSLDRDLAALENPLDGFRDVKALLEKMLLEFQGSKPGAVVPGGTTVAKTQQNSHETPRVPAPKPAGLEIVRSRLGAHLEKVDVTVNLDGSVTVTPKHYLLQETWRSIDQALKPLNAKWIPTVKGIGSWRVAL